MKALASSAASSRVGLETGPYERMAPMFKFSQAGNTNNHVLYQAQ